MNIPDTPIAVTLFNLREYCKTESDLDRTLDKLCEFGYQAVQVSCVPLPPAVIRKQLDKHNLYCCATHSGHEIIRDDMSIVIDAQQTLGCDFTAIGMPPIDWLRDREKLDNMIKILKRNAAELAEHGITLGYHNHDIEFEHVEPHKTILEYIYENCDNLAGELDIHWVQRGGACPVSWIYRLNSRMPVIHFKDFAVINREPVVCEIGEGNLDWKSVIKACRDTNIRWYSIEQDKTVPGRDIFESMKISYDNLSAMLKEF